MPLIFGTGDAGSERRRKAMDAWESLSADHQEMLGAVCDKIGINELSACGIAVKWENEGGPAAKDTLRWLAALERY